jgi:transcriptional regulator with XRE-family HTH domain
VNADRQGCFRFGKTVRTLRKQQSLSQETLADKAAIDRSYMGGIERGERNPTLTMIRRIARALRVDPAKLLKTR